MRITLLVLFFSSSLSALGQLSSPRKDFNLDSFLFVKQTAPIGKPFPAFKATRAGHFVSNQVLNNKIALINFWFEGCHPCMAEMEALDELHSLLKDNKDFVFVTFTWDNSETIKRVIQKYGISFDVLSISQKECDRLLFGNGYPTNMILDKSGTIKYLHAGGSTKKEEAKQYVLQTLLSRIKMELDIR